MRLPLLTASLLTCVLAMSGCATSGQAAKPMVCPVVPKPPASLMNSPSYEQRVRAILFAQPQKPTPKCADCNATQRK